MKNKSVFQQNLRDALKKSQDDDAKDVAETLLMYYVAICKEYYRGDMGYVFHIKEAVERFLKIAEGETK